MPIDKLSDAYREGRESYALGLSLADKPVHFITNEFDVGFIDAMADDVRLLRPVKAAGF
jgi:hypothetical protein